MLRNILKKAEFLLTITRSEGIARRYFVVNGFDGALTMLGMILGFHFSSSAPLNITINACLGAAIALGVSGVSSAYISERAERRRDLLKLEEAMLKNLQKSAHSEAARWVPLMIALINGAAPLFISLVILSPLLLAQSGIVLPVSPLFLAIILALIIVFLLGVFLGRIAGVSWLRSGLQTLFVAISTSLLIYLFTGD
jgi:predicted membrane protein (TIGR00267 family)